jgi:putative endonuclease
MPGAFIYIVKCADGSYYTGLTKQDEPRARVGDHNSGVYEDAYTATRRPVILVYAEHYESIIAAIEAERRIKGWSRAKKEAMMAQDWESLVQLAKRRGGKVLD